MFPKPVNPSRCCKKNDFLCCPKCRAYSRFLIILIHVLQFIHTLKLRQIFTVVVVQRNQAVLSMFCLSYDVGLSLRASL